MSKEFISEPGLKSPRARREAQVRCAEPVKSPETACNWSRCGREQTGRCVSWCKCRCHTVSAAARAERNQARDAFVERLIREAREIVKGRELFEEHQLGGRKSTKALRPIEIDPREFLRVFGEESK